MIFTQGCNLRCPWCHNPELIPEKEGNLTWDEVFTFLQSRQGKLDGVVFTGGEPLLQTDLAELIRQVKQIGFKVKLDTNGTLPERLKILLDLATLDYIAMDVKSDASSFEQITGRSLGFKKVLESIRLIMASGIDYEFRTTLVPGLHTQKVISGIMPLIKGANKYILQNISGFRTLDPKLDKEKPLTQESMLLYKTLATPYIQNIQIKLNQERSLFKQLSTESF